MPTPFDTSFTIGSVIEPSHIQQYVPSIHDLENGSTYFAADSGSTDGYAITMTPVPPDPLPVGFMVHFQANTANTGPATLSINGQDPVPLVMKANEALTTGAILADQVVAAVFDGTSFQLVGPNAPSSVGDLPFRGQVLASSSDQTGLASGATTDIVLGSSLMGSGLWTIGSPSIIKVNTTGKWRFSGLVKFSKTASGTLNQVYMGYKVNGVSGSQSLPNLFTAPPYDAWIQFELILDLAANDEVIFNGTAWTSSNNFQILGGSRIEAVLLGY